MKAIELKALELVNRVADYLHSDERGQTTAEYVAVTAVGVSLAVAVLWGVMSGAISDAVAAISTALTDFVTDPPVAP